MTDRQSSSLRGGFLNHVERFLRFIDLDQHLLADGSDQSAKFRELITKSSVETRIFLFGGVYTMDFSPGGATDGTGMTLGGPQQWLSKRPWQGAANDNARAGIRLTGVPNQVFLWTTNAPWECDKDFFFDASAVPADQMRSTGPFVRITRVLFNFGARFIMRGWWNGHLTVDPVANTATTSETYGLDLCRGVEDAEYDNAGWEDFHCSNWWSGWLTVNAATGSGLSGDQALRRMFRMLRCIIKRCGRRWAVFNMPEAKGAGKTNSSLRVEQCEFEDIALAAEAEVTIGAAGHDNSTFTQCTFKGKHHVALSFEEMDRVTMINVGGDIELPWVNKTGAAISVKPNKFSAEAGDDGSEPWTRNTRCSLTDVKFRAINVPSATDKIRHVGLLIADDVAGGLTGAVDLSLDDVRFEDFKRSIDDNGIPTTIREHKWSRIVLKGFEEGIRAAQLGSHMDGITFHMSNNAEAIVTEKGGTLGNVIFDVPSGVDLDTIEFVKGPNARANCLGSGTRWIFRGLSVTAGTPLILRLAALGLDSDGGYGCTMSVAAFTDAIYRTSTMQLGYTQQGGISGNWPNGASSINDFTAAELDQGGNVYIRTSDGRDTSVTPYTMADLDGLAPGDEDKIAVLIDRTGGVTNEPAQFLDPATDYTIGGTTSDPTLTLTSNPETGDVIFVIRGPDLGSLVEEFNEVKNALLAEVAAATWGNTDEPVSVRYGMAGAGVLSIGPSDEVANRGFHLAPTVPASGTPVADEVLALALESLSGTVSSITCEIKIDSGFITQGQGASVKRAA